MSEFMLPSKESLRKQKAEMIEAISAKIISYETLIDHMADIENKRRTDPKAVIVLLAELFRSEVDIKSVELAKAERLLREIVSMPITPFMCTNKAEFEKMKRLAKEVLKKWADQRRRNLIEMEKLMDRVAKRVQECDVKEGSCEVKGKMRAEEEEKSLEEEKQ